MPLTADRSKAMMPVAGEPMIARVLAMLADGGVDRAVVVAHPHDHELARYLRRSPWATRTQLVYQEERLGMAHAVACAAPLVRELEVADFVLASCDNLYPQAHVPRLIARRRERGLDAALTLLWSTREAAAASAVAVLENGRVTGIIEKPEQSEIPAYGGREKALTVPSLYALSSRVLNYVNRVSPSARGEREFVDALGLLIEDGGAVGGQSVSSRLTLTRPEDLLTINRHFLRTRPKSAVIELEMGRDVSVLPPVRIETGTTVASGCRIGPFAYLEGGCRVGANAVIRQAVILRDARVREGQTIEQCVVGASGVAA